MAWLKKDQQILAYEVQTGEGEDSEFTHYCKNCIREAPETSIISEFITKDVFEQRKDQKLFCDRCGKEIKQP
jgi:hypothetical protein